MGPIRAVGVAGPSGRRDLPPRIAEGTRVWFDMGGWGGEGWRSGVSGGDHPRATAWKAVFCHGTHGSTRK